MNNILGVALAISLVAVIGWDQEPSSCTKNKQVAAQAQCSPPDKMSETTKVRLVKLTDELKLTSDQVAKVRAAFADCQTACSTLTAKFAPLMEEIHALKKAENPDYEAIKAKKAELKALKQQHASELAAHRADLVAKIKAVLAPEQVAKFEQIQSEILGDELTMVASTQ
jgi:Spy/CpxP family protein refolding chaperone